MTLQSSILANGSGGNCSGPVTSAGYNLSDDASCSLVATGDIPSSLNVNLGALADNGGPAQTMLPQAGSDAIEAIPPADCATHSSPTGQRGVVRPQDTNCEIGAVELGSVPVQLITVDSPGGPESSPVTVYAVAFGPAGISFNYGFDCDNDSLYETAGSGSGNAGSATCTFADDGAFTVGVQVCDAGNGANCDTGSTLVDVVNVPPTIDSITTGPASQGQPVTVTVAASDPGINDILTYSFDCDGDALYEVSPQAGNQTACPLDPAQASVTINVLVEDGDGGMATGSVVVSQTVTLCGSYYTGALRAPSAGGCPSGSTLLTLPGATVTTICINPYTGALRWSPQGTCSTSSHLHLIPNDGPLYYCQSRWTGALRYAGVGQCTSAETPGVVPG